jgi:hypothetical protein
MIEYVLNKNPKLIKFIPKEKLTKEHYNKAIKLDGTTLLFVPQNLIDKKMCIKAFKENKLAALSFPKELKKELKKKLKL